ncbi:RNA polymerase sigma-70 factor, ECF subfamily [Neorhodopirellula lusitana]|uniref:RNA polymerase sigma-70 factor, ECF subfamily n=1 Tax=Neorhodopirellula lusitana TaxID=445327 RepID=A0ABY1QFN7_9BACT|nr:sigma-70 family RNA polymerase sigma factor [Neorhodopirellula lusitana]SMP68364.1 RNA polymerase sigma-70 factor, ECF subfamily [Neorhodopirellula lusitana]
MEPSDPDLADFVSHLTECQSTLGMYVRSLMPGDRSAMDVVQQANAKIWEKRNDFQPGTQFRAWAMTIARYEVLNYRKQQARDARLHFSAELETIMAAEIEVIHDDTLDRQEALQTCLGSISPENRELLFFKYRSSETLVDFAERTNRSIGSLKVKLHRLRTSLASCIERKMVATGGSS